MFGKVRTRRSVIATAAAILGGIGLLAAPAFAWEPTRTVEFIVPAGTGGGADQMARVIQGIIAKHQLMKQTMVVINKAGGAGGEGFLDVKNSKGNANKLIITLSNLFTTPMATGIPFSWKDLTPVAMMSLDEFVLWVNAESPYKTVQEYVDAIKAAPPGKFKMGGTGSKQEDQIITVAIEKQTGTKFTYIPFRGGGEVAVQLVGKHVDSTVNNPIEAVAQWKVAALGLGWVFGEFVPGQIAVTRIPSRANCTPSSRLIARTPPLEAVYEICEVAAPIVATNEAVLTMAPLP